MNIFGNWLIAHALFCKVLTSLVIRWVHFLMTHGVFKKYLKVKMLCVCDVMFVCEMHYRPVLFHYRYLLIHLLHSEVL